MILDECNTEKCKGVRWEFRMRSCFVSREGSPGKFLCKRMGVGVS